MVLTVTRKEPYLKITTSYFEGRPDIYQSFGNMEITTLEGLTVKLQLTGDIYELQSFLSQLSDASHVVSSLIADRRETASGIKRMRGLFEESL